MTTMTRTKTRLTTDVIEQVVEDVAARNNGDIVLHEIWLDAHDPAHPFHNHIVWDGEKAAYNYQIGQIRSIIAVRQAAQNATLTAIISKPLVYSPMATRHSCPVYKMNIGPEADQERLRQVVSASNGYSLPALLRSFRSVMEPNEVRLIQRAIESMKKRLV